MIHLLFVLLPGAIVHSLKDSFDNSSFITLAALAVTTVSAAYLLKKKRKRGQRKELRKLKWKMRWSLLKSFFRSKRKLTASEIIVYLIALGIGVLIIIWLGWLWGILCILGLIGITAIIESAKRNEPD
jgi:asparagine N-glycosylation enzyme membrane subunit Stt3